ncbi:hypothetical protein BT69DRAFT_1347756 [Atractiella rhizophila]|nr:hypothetical protein BT69DRAFT_1347756 [Atractiella rhizophila]
MDISRHPIFSLPLTASLVAPEPSTSSLPRRTTALVRTSDLLVACENTIRLANLAEFKSFVDSGENPQNAKYSELKFLKRDGNLEKSEGEVKELKESEKFEILQVVPSQNERLVAVVGKRQVGVFVLPRKGWNATAGQEVAVNYYPIAPLNHSSSSAVITSAQWHPHSLANATLLVLTVDGLLREYDLLTDISEEAQVVDFNANQCIKRFPTPADEGEGFRDDPGAREAVSFCFGEGEGDWGRLTVYGLMRNGDLYGVCPYIPRNAVLDAVFVKTLAVVANEKWNLASTFLDPPPEPSSSSDEESPTLKRALSRSLSSSTRKSPHRPRGPRLRLQNEIEAHYRLQVKYVRELQRQIDVQLQSTQSPSKTKGKGKGKEDDLFNVHPPSEEHIHSVAVRQGPFLLQPSPPELDDEEPESAACEVTYLSYAEEGTGNATGVFLMSWKDGRVDICLEVDKLEPKWNFGRRGRSRVEKTSDLPVLAVWESVDLGLRNGSPKAKPDGGEGPVQTSWSSFMRDPMYPDETIYVYHSFGVHQLAMGDWLSKVWNVSNLQDVNSKGTAWERLLREGKGSAVKWIVNTCGADGYSMLCTTALLQTLSIPMSLKIDPSTVSGPTSSTYTQSKEFLKSLPPKKGITLADGKTQVKEYDSLLKDEPFKVPACFSTAASQSSALEKRKMEQPLVVNAEALKFLGTTVGALRQSVREVFAGGDTLQERLKLQVKELHRQLERVAEVESMKERNVSRYKGNEKKLVTLREKQTQLEERLDKILVKLSDGGAEGNGLEISEREREWINELDRMKQKVEGKGEDESARGLKSRLDAITHQLSVLKPEIELLHPSKSQPQINGASPKFSLAVNGAKSYAERARQSEINRASERPVLGQIQLRFMSSKLQDETKLLKEVTENAIRVESLVEEARKASNGVA